MILTICVFSFLSLTATTADYETCYRATPKELSAVTTACSEVDKDPLSTCEVQRVGATKFFVRIRHLETSSEPPAPAKQKEEV